MRLRNLKTLGLLFWVIFITGYYEASAQTDPYGQVSIASPTAASLGKYADIPVSYHTGIPQVDIPIYTIKAGPLSMPLSVSYHASGLKVIETASWVGAGWSLNAGGVITRTVMGQPDESNTNSGGVSIKGYFSDYGYNNYFYNSNGDQDWLNFSNSLKDGEPDLFFFNFAGYSGKFYFKDDRTPVVIPSQDIKVIPYYPRDDPNYVISSMYEYNIIGFTIITPDGTNYLFGKTPGFNGSVLPFEITNPYSTYTGASSGNVISSWYLNKVSSADGMFSINLSYLQENYGSYTISTNTMDSYTTSTQSSFSTCEFSVVKNIEQGLRLNQITFPNGTVTFNGGAVRTDLSDNIPNVADDPNTNAKTLGSIQITNSSGFCKQFLFSYGYFTDNTSTVPSAITAMGYTFTSDTKRLRLDSIQELSCDNSIQIPAYKFSYFSELVPRRMNFGLDHWGFYNGVTNNSTTIPTYATNDGSTITTVPGANRNAVWPAMRGGALQQITYPTGGSAVFDFEPADNFNYYYTTSQNTNIGSLTVHLYGQSTQYSNTLSITSNGNPITVSANNTSNYPATISIKNSSNTQVYYNANLTENSVSNFQLSNLSAGTYQVTVTLPQFSNLSGGIQCSFMQVANVSSSVNYLVGGLRIKTISRKENSDAITPIVTSYSYPNGGFVYSFPSYIQHIRNDMVATVGYYAVVGQGYSHTSFNLSGCAMGGGFYLKSGGSLRPMATTQGYHIGYPTVKVSQSGNGYVNYNYYTGNTGYPSGVKDLSAGIIDITLNACESTTPNTPAAPLPFDYRKGELSSEQYYNESGDLLKDVYYYPSYNLNSDKGTPAFSIQARSNGGSGTLLLGTFYTLTAPRRTKMVSVETNYTPGIGSVQQTSTTYYGSAFHNQVTRKLVTNSTGDSLITNTRYTPDFRIYSCDATTNCLAGYNSDCSNCLSTYNTARTQCSTSNNLCYTNAYLAYQLCQSNARNTYTSCQKSNYTASTNTFNTCITNAKNSAGTDLKPILELQNENRVAPVELTEWKNANLLHATFTKYDYMNSPSTIPYPSATRLVNLQAVSSTFTDAAVSGNGLTLDGRYLDESAYVSKDGNISQVTNHDGIPLTYLWDYQNTLPVAKVSNTSPDQVAYTSFEADGSGNWSVSGTVTADNTAPTGVYSYNLAGGNISKSGLNAGSAYVLSYWSKSGSAYTITGASGNAVKQGKTINGWTFFEHTITGASSVTVSGGNSIDELRLYPTTAQMTTYTYTPLVGITTECDTDNRINYYQYDSLGRLKLIKDQDGNVVKTMTYHYRNQVGL